MRDKYVKQEDVEGGGGVVGGGGALSLINI